MSENERNNKTESPTNQSSAENVHKKFKNDNDVVEMSNQVAVAGGSGDQLPSIFKLNVDCCDEIFEYLTLKDLHVFGQTCKAMQKVAGQYYQRNFQGAEKFIDDDGIYTVYADDITNKRTRTSAFNSHTEFLSYYYATKQPLCYIDWHITEFTSVKHLYLVCCGLCSLKMASFQSMLPNIEVLQIRQCILWRDDLYEMFLKHCKNLKRLCIQDDIGYIIQNRGNWLLRNYPTLEHIELTPRNTHEIDKLQQFFSLNQNIRSFSTTVNSICANSTDLMMVDTKLEWLEIKQISVSIETFNWNAFWMIMKELHKRLFYKRLHLHVATVDEELSNEIVSLKGLEKLTIEKFSKCYNLVQLEHLKELNILGFTNGKQLEILAKNLTNLERLLLQGATYSDLLPFIRCSVKLKYIKIFAQEAEHFKGDIINLEMLNNEREKLFGARKVIIYIEDNVFLATKWTTKNGDINLNMIEMKRSNSICWDYDYSTLRTLH